jgi:hypothetical protein
MTATERAPEAEDRPMPTNTSSPEDYRTVFAELTGFDPSSGR